MFKSVISKKCSSEKLVSKQPVDADWKHQRVVHISVLPQASHRFIAFLEEPVFRSHLGQLLRSHVDDHPGPDHAEVVHAASAELEEETDVRVHLDVGNQNRSEHGSVEQEGRHEEEIVQSHPLVLHLVHVEERSHLVERV